MIFVLKPTVPREQIYDLTRQMESRGFKTFLSTGTEHTVVCLIGNTAIIDINSVV